MRGTYAAGVVWPSPRPEAARVLVCFTYCGGGPAAYRGWMGALPADVDLALVCLPGRERRMAEPPAQRWDDLMREALSAARSVTARPYVLFGHSMGAWVAYEAALGLAAGGRGPEALVVSAANAPSRASEERLRPPTSRAGDEELLGWMSRAGQLPPAVLADDGLRQMALDLYRADRRAAESYDFVPGRTVACPVRRLAGEEDADVDPVDGGWSALAGGVYRAEVLPGGHFYTEKVWEMLPLYMGI
ncbi:thioesterase II family protein [Phytohabitans houttuyneae]|uniref:Thioesterase n=1 Tax=Phytohabitans houttuyneae TaxID=1076126 RepID=A0A6V8KIE1_9ACTN|nr:alpha/beta fold hydrolase [Phytohabitans houttuyneae]GFJ83604.1 thioesterase [Phytohabitans houttuyneae]